MIYRNILAGRSGSANDIGIAGQLGFGVGAYPGVLPEGFSELAGTQDPTHDNWGNYTYTDGSISCYIPRFYYKIGTGSNGLVVNAIDIKSASAFGSVSDANNQGYALHRAFIDGGAVLKGFFADKYINSKSVDGVSHGRSIKNAVPISLTTVSTYTRSQGMTGCSGILADAVTLSRARGTGWHCMSVFQQNALALISLAHAQQSVSTTNCAWYDATNNFPKGCNNNNLGDANDAAITYTTAGDSGDSKKPLTGSANQFAKTTHNGQMSGVADLNGTMWECNIGITHWGSSATSSTALDSGDAYVANESVVMANLTAGWDGESDVWQSQANITRHYSLYSNLYRWSTESSWFYLGNGANQVFDPAVSGEGYIRTCAGIGTTAQSYGSTGTDTFGRDGTYRYNRHNLFLVSGGRWGGGPFAGVFARGFDGWRSISGYNSFGFRAARPAY